MFTTRQLFALVLSHALAILTGLGAGVVVRAPGAMLALPVAPVAANGQQPQPNVSTNIPVPPSTIDTAQTLEALPAYARVGGADAPLQLVVFSDARCGYCRTFNATLKQLAGAYAESGLLAISRRHFAILGPDSRALAAGMTCAGTLGGARTFEQFGDLALATEDAIDTQSMTAWATDLGIAPARFEACLSDPATQAHIDNERALGERLRVTGTPTLFLNGRPMPGALPFAVLKREIEQALAQSRIANSDR
jgi:protein-disulfide isomerase